VDAGASALGRVGLRESFEEEMDRMKKLIGMLIAAALAACGAPGEEAAAGVEGTPAAEHQVEMTVDGLDCPLCERALQRKLAEIEGSGGFEVDLASGRVTFGLAEGFELNDRMLRDLVEEAGFRLTAVTRAPWIEDPA
jgi:copper chaperone CopZ